MNTDQHRFKNANSSFLTVIICVHLCSFVVPISLAEPPEPHFVPQTIDGAIQIGYGVDTGDVDGDGDLDILLADKKQFVWYRNPAPDKPSAGTAWEKFVMAEDLTEYDNVCLTARDINGDGKVEVAVGGQWNPRETSDPEKSGAVFYLIRPDDPTQKWEPVRIEPHDPTTHRMRWTRLSRQQFVLAVLPLHGQGNVQGQGTPVRVQLVTPPVDPRGQWTSQFIDSDMHMTHNFDVYGVPAPHAELLLTAGREGIFTLIRQQGQWKVLAGSSPIPDGAGEVRAAMIGSPGQYEAIAATIEPMHGNRVAVQIDRGERRVVLDESLNQGHALGVADLMNAGTLQVIAGWRNPNAEGKVGIRMYVPQDEKYENWKTYTIDDNTMACEDLKVADLDGNGRLDIVASGRATKNVIVYWNRTKTPAQQ